MRAQHIAGGVYLVAGAARSLLRSRAGRAWFQRVSGAVLVALGMRLALSRSA